MHSNEVELTRTVDRIKKDKLVSRLVKARVSYLEKWEKIPFFKRSNFGGKKEICVIYVNENQKEQAHDILESFENESFSSDED